MAPRIGEVRRLLVPTRVAQAGSVVRVTGSVRMGTGRQWPVIEAAPGAPTCAVPPEALQLPDAPAPTGPPARQLTLEGAEIMLTDTAERSQSVGTLAPPDSSYSTANTPGLLQVLHVPLAVIEPHPQNPRKTFDPGKLEELAADIRVRGILQPLVVRSLREPDRWQVTPGRRSGTEGFFLMDMRRYQGPDKPYDPPPLFFENEAAAHGAIPCYQLVAGERRWRASALAGLETVPVIVRDDLTDLDVLASMMSENLQRADLNPIETAQGFAALRDAGLRQTQIAERFGLAQPTIANTLALLRLPAAVQELIAAGKLSASHGRVLSRWAELPAYCEMIARLCTESGLTVASLEKTDLPYIYEAELGRPPLCIRLLPSAPFAWQETCRGTCPYNAYRALYEHVGFCFHPNCYKEQVQHAEAERQARAEQIAQAVTGATGEGAAPQDNPLDHLHDLPEGTCVVFGEFLPNGLGRLSEPAGCRRGECERYLQGRFRDQQRQACFDPGCYKKLVAAAANAERQARESAAASLVTRAEATIAAVSTSEAARCRLLAPLVFETLKRATEKHRREALEAVSLSWSPDLFDVGYEAGATAAECLELLSELAETVLLRLAALAILPKERQNAASPNTWDQAETRILHWWAGSVHESDRQELRRRYRETSGEQRAARDAARASAGLPPLSEAVDHPPAECIPGDEADPEDDREIRELAIAAGEICARCGSDIPEEIIAATELDGVLPDGAEHVGESPAYTLQGHLITTGLVYCPECAPDVQVCRQCGCTDEAACEGGCAWVEPDLCSACAGVKTFGDLPEMEEPDVTPDPSDPSHPSQEKPAPMCSACGGDIPAGSLEAWERQTDEERIAVFDAAGAVVEMQSGAQVAKTGRWYCAGCVPTLRICRICGRSELDDPALAEDLHWATAVCCRACAEFGEEQG